MSEEQGKQITAPDGRLAHYRRQATLVATRLLAAGWTPESVELRMSGYHLHEVADVDVSGRVYDTGQVYLSHGQGSRPWDRLTAVEKLAAVDCVLSYYHALGRDLRREYQHGDEQMSPCIIVGERYQANPVVNFAP